jgi:hypothetical protein
MLCCVVGEKNLYCLFSVKCSFRLQVVITRLNVAYLLCYAIDTSTAKAFNITYFVITVSCCQSKQAFQFIPFSLP